MITLADDRYYHREHAPDQLVLTVSVYRVSDSSVGQVNAFLSIPALRV